MSPGRSSADRPGSTGSAWTRRNMGNSVPEVVQPLLNPLGDLPERPSEGNADAKPLRIGEGVFSGKITCARMKGLRT